MKINFKCTIELLLERTSIGARLIIPSGNPIKFQLIKQSADTRSLHPLLYSLRVFPILKRGCMLRNAIVSLWKLNFNAISQKLISIDLYLLTHRNLIRSCAAFMLFINDGKQMIMIS